MHSVPEPLTGPEPARRSRLSRFFSNVPFAPSGGPVRSRRVRSGLGRSALWIPAAAGAAAAGIVLAGLRVPHAPRASGGAGRPADGRSLPASLISTYSGYRGIPLTSPVVSVAGTPDAAGYWLVASDGGIFAFGDARFHGLTGGVRLAQPIASMATTADGAGYWLVARDGGIFSFGDAGFHGSASGAIDTRVLGLVRAGRGYWTLAATGALVSFGAPAPPPGLGLPAALNPSTSVPPSSAFTAACEGGGTATQCDAAALADINALRAGEGYGPLPLPTGFELLPFSSQLVAVTNAERTSRGLPAWPENANLDAISAVATSSGREVTGPSGYTWTSDMATGFTTPLATDFDWMYDDGPGGPNIACSATGTGSCWTHRDNILVPWSGQAGGGSYGGGRSERLAGLFVQSYP